jgi:hypothetical protein
MGKRGKDSRQEVVRRGHERLAQRQFVADREQSLIGRLLSSFRKNRKLLFDALILLLQVILFARFREFFLFLLAEANLAQSHEANVAESVLGVLWLCALAGQIAGAHLKRVPLQRRLAQQEWETPKGLWGCLGSLLLLMHFVSVLVTGAFILAMLAPPPSGTAGGVVGAGAILLVSLLSTVLVVRALKPLPPSQQGIEINPKDERLADFLLFPGMILGALVFDLFAAFWIQIEREAFQKVSLGGHVFGLFIYLYIFSLTYLPPRLLFLAEDYKSRATWLRIALVAVPPLLYFFD